MATLGPPATGPASGETFLTAGADPRKYWSTFVFALVPRAVLTRTSVSPVPLGVVTDNAPGDRYLTDLAATLARADPNVTLATGVKCARRAP